MAEFLITISPAAFLRYEEMSKETGRTVENLIAHAAEEAALAYYKFKFKDDPVRKFNSDKAAGS